MHRQTYSHTEWMKCKCGWDVPLQIWMSGITNRQTLGDKKPIYLHMGEVWGIIIQLLCLSPKEANLSLKEHYLQCIRIFLKDSICWMAWQGIVFIIEDPGTLSLWFIRLLYVLNPILFSNRFWLPMADQEIYKSPSRHFFGIRRVFYFHFYMDCRF